MQSTPDLPGSLPHGLPDPASAAQLEALAADLRAAGLPLLRSAGELEGLAADGFVYSPVLQPLLCGLRAQIGVRVQAPEEVLQVAAACSRHGVSLTVRGAATGNYGQCIPLAGGLLLETSGLNRLRQVDASSGVFTAEPGIVLAELDRQLLAHGREQRLLPSTVRTACLGGYVAGGSGGIGSLRWGFLRDPGHLLGVEMATLEAEPRLLQLDASAARPLNHAYGTNGIFTALTMASAPAVAWRQWVLDFEDWSAALAAAQQLSGSALELKALCVLEAAVAARLPWPQGCPDGSGGAHRLLLLAAPDATAVLESWIKELGGRLSWSAPQGQSRGVPLRELTWNHTTLHVRSQDSGWTYLQLLLPQPEAPALEALRERWGDDLLWHLEAVRSQGRQRFACLPLVRWRGAQALQELIDQARDLGCLLFNPHVISVEDGGLGVVDADQVDAKRAYDPAGLMNPGKLRGWT